MLSQAFATRWWRLAALLAPLAAAPGARAVTLLHSNPHPEIQMWSYPTGSADGAGSVRDRAATFAGFSAIDDVTGQTQYYAGSGLSPSRRASMLVATDTSLDIPSGLSPDRYQIDSLRVAITLMGSLIYEEAGFVLPYDGTLDSAEALKGGSDDPGNPIEMYGVGLQGDYVSFGFGAAPALDKLQLGNVRWRPYRQGEPGHDPTKPAGEQDTAPYQYYAIDAQGRDAENSVAGGYSATEPTATTAAFTPEPFAVGKLYDTHGVEFEPGTLLQSGDLFMFEPDLTNDGIRSYVQRSLSEGALGFLFSSMHQPNGHLGTTPYPDFYLDDLDVGPNPDGAAPNFELSVTVLPRPGDYNNDSIVDSADYDRWRSQYGSAGPDADGNLDGVVDAADYTVWRNNLDEPSYASAAYPAPEPQASLLVGLALATTAFCGWAEWIARPHRDGGE